MMTIIEQLNSTRSRLLSKLDGLSDEQLNWKPDNSTWSIAQVVQHIAMGESGIVQPISLGLAQNPTFIPKTLPLDQRLLDRSRKVNAPERLHPSTEPKTIEELKEMLHNSREKFLEVLSHVKDSSLLDKTSPPVPHPAFDDLSTRQWIEFGVLHEARHILQISELKERFQSN